MLFADETSLIFKINIMHCASNLDNVNNALPTGVWKHWFTANTLVFNG